ncbi:MAG: aminoacyl-tRNA hydrolase [Candidatus Pacebacteria bacterium]|nr:aminoacyl-tRNA hydrolase [Candidatus Paceibacterota bacterium]
MKIIIGLGNPGNEYRITRHNVGFFVLDKTKDAWNFPDFNFEKKFNAEISAGNAHMRSGDDKIFLVKPQTFMNLSGDAVRAVLDFYKLRPDDIFVIHDDLDIELGKFKLATDSRSAGHNGVQNIIDRLGTQKFKRLRIGISQTPEEKAACPLATQHDFVLGKFSESELETLEKVAAEILEELPIILT